MKTPPTLAYCLNVFPGRSTAELWRTLKGPVARLRRLYCPSRTLAVEMHVGQSLAEELTHERRRLDELASLLADLGLQVVAVNAFPIGDFHQDRVKSSVFCPTWLDEARVETTMLAGEILAGLLTGSRGSVSTSPGTYRGFGVDSYTRETVARQMVRVVRHYADLERKTGRRIVLAVEPEPWGMLETVDEAVDFFGLVEGLARGLVPRGTNGSGRDASAVVRRYLGVNVDLCHQSVMFEDQNAGFDRLQEAGICVPKVHVSSAVAVDDPSHDAEGMQLLLKLGEDRYLHQVVGLGDDGKVRRVASDIPYLTDIDPQMLARQVQIRAHVHVPIHLARLRKGATTAGETARAVREILARDLSRTLVVETYTWSHVQSHLAELEGTGDPVEGMAGELGWLAGLVTESEEAR